MIPQPPKSKAGKKIGLIVILSITIAGAILVFDLMTPLGIAGGVPYVALVLVGLIARKPRGVILLAILGSGLTVLGYYLSPAGGSPHVVLINRGLALFAIWATAIVCHLHLASLARLEPLANRDQLTNLYNRHYFFRELNKQIEKWKRYRHPLSLIMLDIDHFKRINDRHGHLAGDEVLRAVAKTCNKSVRVYDTVSRVGGEEFVLLLPFTDLARAKTIAERIRRVIAKQTVRHDGARIHLTVSMGLVEIGEDRADATVLFKTADEALYRAKQGGRNRVAAADG
jgi:diguanylate cyclase (GGDEF)-like protein